MTTETFPMTADERYDAELAEFDAKFGEPETLPQIDPVAKVIDAAIAFNVKRIAWISDANRLEYAMHPPRHVLVPLAALFVTFDQQHATWPRIAWPFLHVLRRMAELILPVAPEWFDEHFQWEKELFLSDQLDRSLQTYLSPPPAPERRVAAMEPLAELVALKIPPFQIANMVGWYVPGTKTLDSRRVERAMVDPVAEPWPTMIELEATPDGLPDSPPLMGIIHDVGQLAAAALAGA